MQHGAIYAKALSPVLEELAEEYAGKVDFYKVDVDKTEDLAGAFGIRSIPTLLFIPLKGQPQITQGALPKTAIKGNYRKGSLNKNLEERERKNPVLQICRTGFYFYYGIKNKSKSIKKL